MEEWLKLLKRWQEGLVDIDSDEELGVTTYSIKTTKREKEIEKYANCISSNFVINDCNFPSVDNWGNASRL